MQRKEPYIYKNNFDFLRLLFAVFVIISHSYPLSGSHEKEWLLRITHNQMSLSYVGVAGFFVISGYLVMQSLLRSRNLTQYYLKRGLRIYPALIGVLAFTVFLGPFVYNGSIWEYIKNSSVWTYIPRNLSLFKFQYSIRGIFEDNPFKSAINGSLCTLPYEVMFYAVLSLLFFINSVKHKIMIITIAFCGVMIYLIFMRHYLIMHACPYPITRAMDYSGGFIAGSILAFFDIKKIKYKKAILLFSVILWIISLWFNAYAWLQYLVLPLTVIITGTSSSRIINNLKHTLGDISYGIYIYAFPIQQTLEHFFRLDTIPLMLWSIIVTLPLAWMSWHLIEKKALAKKIKLISLNS